MLPYIAYMDPMGKNSLVLVGLSDSPCVNFTHLATAQKNHGQLGCRIVQQPGISVSSWLITKVYLSYIMLYMDSGFIWLMS